MWVVYRVFVYYGFLKIGIISTILMIMLGPIFVYFLAWKFLKEKISWKNIIASFIIVASVVYVMFFRNFVFYDLIILLIFHCF